MKTRLLPLSLLATVAWGQSSVPSETTLQAIVGARIEIGDGRVLETGTVLMRDGIIAEVGPKVVIPPGTQILDGKGLTVFPGFIDAYTTKGVKLPDPQPNQDDTPDFSSYAPAMMREANRKGITPELHAYQYLNLTDDLRKSYWNAGFTTAMVVPGAGNLGGTGTLVNLDRRPARTSVLVEDTGLDCGLSRGGGFPGPGQLVLYPGTVLGYIAAVRQTLLDAGWYSQVASAFKAGGPTRPPADPSLVALQPVLQGAVPVYFEADGKKWMERSLGVSDEFHLKPVLVGAKEAWKIVPRIKRDQIPLIVSLDFGKEPDPAKPSAPPSPTQPPGKPANSPQKPSDATGPNASSKVTEDDPEPKEQIGERQRLYREQLSNPIALDKAGVPFSLSTKGVKDLPEFMSNLRRAVKEGLPRQTALAALTVQPARLFGMADRLGSLEKGKIANLVVLTADFLDEKVKTKMIYIDGRRIDPSRTSPPAAPRPFQGGE